MTRHILQIIIEPTQKRVTMIDNVETWTIPWDENMTIRDIRTRWLGWVDHAKADYEKAREREK